VKIRTDEDFAVLYREGEPLVALDLESKFLEVDENLTEEDYIEIITTLMDLLHQYVAGDSLPLPENPASIPYMRQ